MPDAALYNLVLYGTTPYGYAGGSSTEALAGSAPFTVTATGAMTTQGLAFEALAGAAPFTVTATGAMTAQGATYKTAGTDVTKHDSGVPGATWASLSWTATLPAGTLVKARLRAAATEGGLAAATWTDYVTVSGGAAVATGQWVEVEWRLETTDVTATPILSSGTITQL